MTATVIGHAIVIGRLQLLCENYVFYKIIGKQKYGHVILRSLNFAIAEVCKFLYVKLIYYRIKYSWTPYLRVVLEEFIRFEDSTFITQ